jgi:uncharacterized protein (DUF362 family)
MNSSKVVVLKTFPEKVIEDYGRLMHLSEYQNILPKNTDTIIKLNLSSTKFYPSCSTPPWQLDGVLNTLITDGYDRHMLYPLENKLAANPRLGAYNNRWVKVLEKYDIDFTSLADVEWVKYEHEDELMIMPKLFREGIFVPKMFMGKSVIHLPTMKTRRYAITSGAVENACGGLLKEFRYYGPEYIHKVLIDLLIMQKKIHPVVFAIMDATVCGDRTEPMICNYLLASSDLVALDAVAAKMMGFDPAQIGYIRMADERGLGCGRLRNIEIAGDNIKDVNFHFKQKKGLAAYGDNLISKCPLGIFEEILFHTKLANVFSAASGLCHDGLWYPTVGRRRIREFLKTGWGKLFLNY